MATIPQGAKLTATAKQGTDPVWYRVTYNATPGWIAGSLPGTKPTLDLVSIHPQLSFSSSGNDYYFLYPATWSVADRGADVEVDAPSLIPSPTGAATPTATPSSPAGAATDHLLLHMAAGIDKLGNIPTMPGSNLDSTQIEIGGFTVIEHVYQLSGGGFEADVKISWTSGKALLISFHSATQPGLDVFHEMLESFGFSVPASPAPAASP